MTTIATKRDYSLLGRDAEAAVASGLAAAEWYHTDIQRKQMKELMKREDGPAIRDTAIWLGSMVLLGGLGIYFWGSWWAAPFSWPMASFTVPLPIAAGMNAAMAPLSRRCG